MFCLAFTNFSDFPFVTKPELSVFTLVFACFCLFFPLLYFYAALFLGICTLVLRLVSIAILIISKLQE